MSNLLDLYSICLEINECDSHPCANGGTCEDKLANFKCKCAPGYTGVQCQTGIEQSKDFYNVSMKFLKTYSAKN